MMNQNGVNVRVESPKTKDEANKQYLADHADHLQLQGFQDAGKVCGSTDYLRTQLDVIRKKYHSWCAEQAELFKEEIMKRQGAYQRLVSEYAAKERALLARAEAVSEKKATLQKQLVYAQGRSFLVQDLLVLLLNMAAVAALGFWLVYFYANAYVLWQVVPTELLDDAGNLVLFRMGNLPRGWFLSAVPLAVAVALGMLIRPEQKWLRLLVSLLFVVLDATFSILIEEKLVAAYYTMGVDYVFDWKNVLLITFFGMVPSFVMAFLLGSLKQNVLFDRKNAARAENRVLEDQLKAVSEDLAKLNEEVADCAAKRKELEVDLGYLEKSNISALWYSGNVEDSLFNSYFLGWARFLGAMPNVSTVNNSELLAQGREVLDEFLQRRAA